MHRRPADSHVDGAVRAGLAIISAFVALTAIGGGLALLTGLESERYPVEDLAGTPFTTYVIPALLLAGVVGGSAALAFATCLRARWFRASIVAIAGAILMGWILGEVAVLRPPRWSWIEILYFALGAALVAGALPRLVGRRRRRIQQRERS